MFKITYGSLGDNFTLIEKNTDPDPKKDNGQWYDMHNRTFASNIEAQKLIDKCDRIELEERGIEPLGSGHRQNLNIKSTRYRKHKPK